MQRFALERQNSAIDQNVHGNWDVEFDVLDGLALSQRMLDMGAVVEARQHTQQAEAADGPPADKFDETVGRVGLRSDEHRPTSVLAVVEGEEQAAAVVPLGF